MTSKKWCIMFLVSLITVLGIIILLNVLVDPFGVFGDRIFNWYSHSFTNNPRVAKISYLDKHYEEYDSYIIGGSSTSSFTTEDLNKYFNAKFYNMIMYGSDMLDVEQTCKYILSNYNVKNIIVNVYLESTTVYDEEGDKLTKNLHAKVNGENKVSFYSRYLTVSPSYAFAKIRDAQKDTYLTQTFDVFDVETGAYDKKVRDVEPIGDIESYLEKNPIFINYPHSDIVMTKINETVSSIKRIKEMCDESNVNLVIVTAPSYYEYLKCFSKEDILDFYTKMAEITPFWDFASSSISKEPRYFYDETHFRNAVGKMAIARMFDDISVYYPDDFGEVVTVENVKEHVDDMFDIINDTNEYTLKVPILMYHHIKEGADLDVTITPELFEEHIKTLSENGYTGVMINDLVEYVEKGIPLPEKPICITFDDGYLSNYELAFPILKKYNMKATIFVIGSSIGKDKYKDTNYEIIPHFGFEEANIMQQSRLIDIQSHTYDMHQSEKYESGDKVRESAVELKNETEGEFIKALTDDYNKMEQIFEEKMNKKITALAYPHGEYSTLSSVVLKSLGVKATFGTVAKSNTIIKGLPQSLIGLNRYNICEEVSTENLLSFIEE